jgi:hypothetical protein
VINFWGIMIKYKNKNGLLWLYAYKLCCTRTVVGLEVTELCTLVYLGFCDVGDWELNVWWEEGRKEERDRVVVKFC